MRNSHAWPCLGDAVDETQLDRFPDRYDASNKSRKTLLISPIVAGFIR